MVLQACKVSRRNSLCIEKSSRGPNTKAIIFSAQFGKALYVFCDSVDILCPNVCSSFPHRLCTSSRLWEATVSQRSPNRTIIASGPPGMILVCNPICLKSCGLKDVVKRRLAKKASEVLLSHFVMMSLLRQTNWNVTLVSWWLLCRKTNCSWCLAHWSLPALVFAGFKLHFPKGKMKQSIDAKMLAPVDWLSVSAPLFPHLSHFPYNCFRQGHYDCRRMINTLCSLLGYETWKKMREKRSFE